MTKPRPFRELASPVNADPQRRARITAQKQAIRDIVDLAALRQERQITQYELAQKLGVSQANISRIEHEDDVYLSTLQEYVAALGGEIRITVVFPDHAMTPNTESNSESAG